MKPPTAKARLLHAKLTALAERGYNGEQAAAIRKLAKLEARFNFDAPPEKSTTDLFNGTFQRSTQAESIGRFKERDIGDLVKWAIEQATGIPCLFRGEELLAEATPKTAVSLSCIAGTMAKGFSTLWKQFSAIPGVNPSDKSLFYRGAWDGCMGEVKPLGQPLPTRSGKITKLKAKKGAVVPAGLNLHPYTIALGLGRSIRFSVPLPDIQTALENAMSGQLGTGGTP